MTEHTLRVLEFDKILERLAACAACSLGKSRARRLRPGTDPRVVAERLAETSEARWAIERHGPIPFGGLRDVGDLLAQSRIGATLLGPDLRRLADSLRCTRLVQAYFAEIEDPVACTRLQAFVARLHDHTELEAAIEKAVDDLGEVRDDASPTLVELRRKLSVAQQRLHDRLGAILARDATRGVLQEPLIVQREGRYCLPVRSDQQGHFGGIIHGRSDSGATVFMEPLELVELGNEVREHELAVEQEKLRILQELSRRVEALAEEIEQDQRTLGVLDFISAKARLAGAQDAHEPQIGAAGVLHLRAACHPLLEGDVVPIDVWLGDEFTTLLITGPNTGGKTVALKTVGLLCVMAQAGLHIPAVQGSIVPVFDEVAADIGDEQSIEQSLSTFSSHLTQIVRVLHGVRRRRSGDGEGSVNALVLLDEIGAGTDPTEGAALARAILEELHALGVRTIATSHYNDLKTFVYEHEGMENASVEFDVQSLRPTYRLLIGQPGTSNAFVIARRLGLPRRIAQRAQSYVGGDVRVVEDVIRRMEQTQQRLDAERGEATAERRQMQELRTKYEDQLRRLEERRRQEVEQGYEEARRIVQEAETEARRIIAAMQREPRQSRITEEGRREIGALRERLAQQTEEAVGRAPACPEPSRRVARPPPSEPAPTPLVPPDADQGPPPLVVEEGDLVHVPALHRDGVVAKAISADLSLVEVGKMRVEIRNEELRPPEHPVRREYQATAERLHIEKSMTVDPEVDLRGQTVDEAIVELEKYLDDAALAGLHEVRIIHGKGTGALRQGIHRFLRGHRRVRSLQLAERSEGGEGATVVTL